MVEYRTRNRQVAGSTHTRSTASNFEQVANLLRVQANSASYPQRDGKWVVATATGESLAWLIGAMVCLLAAPWVQLSVSAGNGWPHNALRHHWLIPIRCHFRDCKALLVTSLTYVSGAIASVRTFTNTTANHLSKLNVLNNTLLRIVQKKSIKTHNNDLYKSYFTLPLQLLH